MKLLMNFHKKSNMIFIVIMYDLNVVKLVERSIEILDGKILNMHNSKFKTN